MATVHLPSITGPTDLLAVVPYLLGFHPTDSIVVIGMRGTALTFTARVDLPPPDVAEELADLVAQQDVDNALLVGYGPPGRTEPALLALRSALAMPVRALPVRTVLRVTGDRYWCLDSGGPGVPFDPSASPIAAAATYAGAVALPDRDALVASIAPVTGTARVSMRGATHRALVRLRRVRGALAVRGAGRTAVREAVARQAAGGVLTDDEVGWLTVLLRTAAVRDFAWQSIDDPAPHIALWTDVVRRASPDLVAAPAGLLSFAAWRAGEGALAAVAVARALEVDPAYSMAKLMEEILCRGVPPSTLDGVRRGGGRRTSRGIRS